MKLLRYNPIAILVRRLINAELRAMLEDIDYRIKLLDDGGRIGSHQLTLKHHILDGFTFTDNSPTAGNIAWSGCHIVYQGVDITITNGNTSSSAIKYIWWDYDATPNTIFQQSTTKPTLTDADCLVAINDGGIHRLVIGQGRMQHGAFLLGTSLSSGEYGAGSVIESVLGSGSVTSGKIGSGAVLEAALGAGAVTSGKIGTGAVLEAALGAGAVTEGKLGNLAVTAAKIQNLTITGSKVVAGTFDSTKLNLLAHLLY